MRVGGGGGCRGGVADGVDAGGEEGVGAAAGAVFEGDEEGGAFLGGRGCGA